MNFEQTSAEHQTRNGTVKVYSNNSLDFIKNLGMEEGMGGLTKYSDDSLVQEKNVMLDIIGEDEPRNDVVVAVNEEKIIGYITLVKSGFNERWAKQNIPLVAELGFIEVSRNWRQLGIGSKMLEAAFKGDRFEDYLVYSTEYSWHWDMQYNHLSKGAYHDMLLKIFKRAGFEQYDTDDEDIIMDWANMLTVRTGGNINIQTYQKFILCLRKDAWKYGL